MAAGIGFPEEGPAGLAVPVEEEAAEPEPVGVADPAGDEGGGGNVFDFERVDAAGVGGPGRDAVGHPVVEEGGTLSAGGVAVEVDFLRVQPICFFEFCDGSEEGASRPAFRFPVFAVAEGGGEQEERVAVGEPVEVEGLQRFFAGPVASAEEDEDPGVLVVVCGGAAGEGDAVDGPLRCGALEMEEGEEEDQEEVFHHSAARPHASAMLRLGRKTRSSGRMFFALAEFSG